MARIDHHRFCVKVRRLLLAMGEKGITQNDLYHRTKTTFFKGQELNDLLTAWEGRGWVQCFKVRFVGSKKPSIVWRATVRLRDEWNEMALDFVSEIGADDT